MHTLYPWFYGTKLRTIQIVKQNLVSWMSAWTRTIEFHIPFIPLLWWMGQCQCPPHPVQSLELPSSPSVSTPNQKAPNKSCTQQIFIRKKIVPNNCESLRNGPDLTLVSHEYPSARPSAKAPGFCCRCLCCIYLTDKSHLELSTVPLRSKRIKNNHLTEYNWAPAQQNDWSFVQCLEPKAWKPQRLRVRQLGQWRGTWPVWTLVDLCGISVKSTTVSSILPVEYLSSFQYFS